MDEKIIIGIDPGKSGGWAFCDKFSKATTYGAYPMPIAGDEIDVSTITQFILSRSYTSRPCKVIIEKVHSMPKQGVASTFKFGQGYGQLIGMCQALAVPYELVPPQRWKKTVLKDTKMDKDAAIEFARRTYPSIPLVLKGCRKPHDGIADALCLMTWGIQQND